MANRLIKVASSPSSFTLAFRSPSSLAFAEQYLCLPPHAMSGAQQSCAALSEAPGYEHRVHRSSVRGSSPVFPCDTALPYARLPSHSLHALLDTHALSFAVCLSHPSFPLSLRTTSLFFPLTLSLLRLFHHPPPRSDPPPLSAAPPSSATPPRPDAPPAGCALHAGRRAARIPQHQWLRGSRYQVSPPPPTPPM
eukprot:1637138-Rhodomonas_salina.4